MIGRANDSIDSESCDSFHPKLNLVRFYLLTATQLEVVEIMTRQALNVASTFATYALRLFIVSKVECILAKTFRRNV